jgi:AcrR family transcriptional regulator
LLAAGAVAVAEHGYANHTISHLTVGAGVSRRTFYEHFTGKEDVLLAAYDAIFVRLLAAIERACSAEGEWSARLAGAVAAGLHFAVAEPEASRLLTVDAIAACPEGAERVLRSKDRLATMLLPGRHVSRRATQLPALTESGLIAALWSAVGAELLRGRPDRLVELQPQLVEMSLMAYREGPPPAAC